MSPRSPCQKRICPGPSSRKAPRSAALLTVSTGTFRKSRLCASRLVVSRLLLRAALLAEEDDMQELLIGRGPYRNVFVNSMKVYASRRLPCPDRRNNNGS